MSHGGHTPQQKTTTTTNITQSLKERQSQRQAKQHGFSSLQRSSPVLGSNQASRSRLLLSCKSCRPHGASCPLRNCFHRWRQSLPAIMSTPYLLVSPNSWSHQHLGPAQISRMILHQSATPSLLPKTKSPSLSQPAASFKVCAGSPSYDM